MKINKKGEKMGFLIISIIGVVVGLILAIVGTYIDRNSWSANSDMMIIGWSLLIISVIFTAIFTMARINAKTTVQRLRNESSYYMQCIDTMSDYELSNLGITHKVIEYNKEIAEAQANVEVCGKWSFYYGTNVEELEYIGIK